MHKFMLLSYTMLRRTVLISSLSSARQSSLLKYCLLYELCAFSGLTLLVGWQEGHPACKKINWWVTGMVFCLE